MSASWLSSSGKPKPAVRRRGWERKLLPWLDLATDPLLVLADEPTANLDADNGRQTMEIMQKLNEETGTAFILATRDPRVVSFAGRIVHMRDGAIVDDDASHHVLKTTD